jgi:hypothetical protein
MRDIGDPAQLPGLFDANRRVSLFGDEDHRPVQETVILETLLYATVPSQQRGSARLQKGNHRDLHIAIRSATARKDTTGVVTTCVGPLDSGRLRPRQRLPE